MRVTTAQSFNLAIDELQRRQQGLAEAQMQLTSGKRVQRASDDPTAAARAERALAAIARSSADQRALEASRNAMRLTESALGDAAELLQQARETMVAAGNASYTDGERNALAIRLRELREQLFAVANRADGIGGYLFGGSHATVPPFVNAPAPPGGVSYHGGAGRMTTASSEPLPLTVDGGPAWVGVFGVLDRALAELRTPGRTNAQIMQTVSDTLLGLDASMHAQQGLRAEVGEVLGRIDMAEARIAALRLHGQTERSNAEDLDMVQAISEFQNRQTGYDAALRAYAMVQRMSLLQHL
jgi:flagellar hook-associated protein 3 FlgL